MITLNRLRLLNTLIKHETLTLADLGKKENLGLIPNKLHLQHLLDQLEQEECIEKLNGTSAKTYTITEKGIAEGNRLKAS